MHENEIERFDEGFRADLIVERKVIIELKSVESVHPGNRHANGTHPLTGIGA